MCRHKDEKLTKVFQNLSGKIIGWKIYYVPDKTTKQKFFLSSSYLNADKRGGKIEKEGIIESDWMTAITDSIDLINHGIHVYLDKKDALPLFKNSRCSVVQVEIAPQDVLAVGIVCYNYTRNPIRRSPMSLVAKKVKITRNEFRKAKKQGELANE